MTIEVFLPTAVTIAASILAGAWCLTHGSTISASAAVEKDSPSVWGVSLNFFGVLLMIYGFGAGLMLSVETISPLYIMLMGILLFLGFALVVIITKTRGDEDSIKGAMENISSWGYVTALIIFLSLFFILSGGGEGDVIPAEAWPLLMGALTMIGSGFAAALCIVAAVKAGAEMLTEKPELSIWSLLFVALGEGLAIYGLIVSILLIGG